MASIAKYKKVFGSINSLSDYVPWTIGMTNLVEDLIMDTKKIFGISKPEFCLLIDQETKNEKYKKKILDLKVNHIQNILEKKQDEIRLLNLSKKGQSEKQKTNEVPSLIKFISEDQIRFIVKETENYEFKKMSLDKKVGHIERIFRKKLGGTGILNHYENDQSDNCKGSDELRHIKDCFENYIELILKEIENDKFRIKITKAKRKHYKSFLAKIGNNNDLSDQYDDSESGYRSGRESLRRIKYFSEDFVNKEFDIFMSLSSDNYLDYFYKNIITLKEKGQWVTHGNGSMYSNSVDIDGMQMDNLAYNTNEEILIANELKLGGDKNPDQLLKYCFMFHELKKKQFISQNSKFVLLFIGDKKEQFELNEEIDREVSHLRKNPKKTFLITTKAINFSLNMSVKNITWNDIIILNNQYSKTLIENQQVEMKLIKGFNASLKEKGDLYSLYQNE